MELRNIIEIIFLFLLIFSGIAIFVFFKRTKQDDDYDYYKIIKFLDDQKESNLKLLEERNKEIDKIESKILECKKELKMKLFDK